VAVVDLHIDAPPDRVWRLVSDVTRMGEWSPICYRCEWLDGATGPQVGARFKGYNKQGPSKWSTTCEVVESVPGKVFAFTVMDGTYSFFFRNREHTRWRYEFEPDGIGTKVTESNDVVGTPPLLRLITPVLNAQAGQREAGMRTTLERLKAAAEEGVEGD
jgi:uncharacterized protein YndB with AHSA1/START domain